MKSICGPKSVQNEVGTRVGKVIGKRRAKEGFVGANIGSEMGHVGLKIEEDWSQKVAWKKEAKKRVRAVDPRKFPGSGARRKPLAKAKGSSEERRNGGLED